MTSFSYQKFDACRGWVIVGDLENREVVLAREYGQNPEDWTHEANRSVLSWHLSYEAFHYLHGVLWHRSERIALPRVRALMNGQILSLNASIVTMGGKIP